MSGALPLPSTGPEVDLRWRAPAQCPSAEAAREGACRLTEEAATQCVGRHRETHLVEQIERLQAKGAKIRLYDPVAMSRAKEVLKNVTFCRDAYEATRGADCLALVTEWPQFKALDFSRILKNMVSPILVDGRNLFDPAEMQKLGFDYKGMGR